MCTAVANMKIHGNVLSGRNEKNRRAGGRNKAVISISNETRYNFVIDSRYASRALRKWK